MNDWRKHIGSDVDDDEFVIDKKGWAAVHDRSRENYTVSYVHLRSGDRIATKAGKLAEIAAYMAWTVVDEDWP